MTFKFIEESEATKGTITDLQREAYKTYKQFLNNEISEQELECRYVELRAWANALNDLNALRDLTYYRKSAQELSKQSYGDYLHLNYTWQQFDSKKESLTK